LGFIGSYSLNLDDKLRVTIPARLKAVLQRKYGGDSKKVPLIVTLSLLSGFKSCAVYPVEEYRELTSFLKQLPVFDLDSQRLLGVLNAFAAPCEMDAQGRIRLERKLATTVKLKRNVLVVGRGRFFEIWDETLFDENLEEIMEESRTTAGKVMEYWKEGVKPEELKSSPAGGSVPRS